MFKYGYLYDYDSHYVIAMKSQNIKQDILKYTSLQHIITFTHNIFGSYQLGLFRDVVNVMQAVSEEWSSGKYIGCGNIYLYIDCFNTH